MLVKSEEVPSDMELKHRLGLGLQVECPLQFIPVFFIFPAPGKPVRLKHVCKADSYLQFIDTSGCPSDTIESILLGSYELLSSPVPAEAFAYGDFHLELPRVGIHAGSSIVITIRK